MPKLRDVAYIRHAQFYKERLKELDDQYISGGDNSVNGLKLFDVEWENIRRGYDWTVENAPINSRAAELCVSYSDVGAFCLDLRLNPRELIRWQEIGVDISKRLDDRVSESLHYGNLGLAYFSSGEIDRAVDCYKQQILLSQENGSVDIEAIGTANLGYLYSELGEFQNSIQYQNQALDYFRAQKISYYQAALLGNLGNVYLESGINYQLSAFLDKSINNLENQVAYFAQTIKSELLEPVLIDRNSVETAITNYKTCLEIAKEIRDFRIEGSVLGNLGAAYYLLENIDSSLEYLQEGIAILSKIGFTKGISILYGILGLALIRKNNLKDALESHKKQLFFAKGLDIQTECLALFHLGYIYYLFGDQSLAIEYFQGGMKLIQGQKLKFPKIDFNLVASSKKRYTVDSILKKVDLILKHTKKFFENAGFNIETEISTENGFIVSTSQWNSHKQYGNIFIKAFSGELTGENLIDLQKAIKQTNISCQIAYAIYEENVTDSAFFQMGAFHLGNNLTIVPLEFNMITESMFLKREQLYRNLCIIEQKYLSHSNPYDMSNAISDSTLFFGRQSETDAIIKRLKAVQHVGVFGIRKIGKTSFLYHLKRRLAYEKIPVAYIGLQNKQFTPYKLFYDALGQFRDFLKTLGITNIPQTRLLVPTADIKVDQIFAEEIQELSRLLQILTGSSLMVIMVDEVERIVPNDADDDLSYRKFDEFFTPIRELSQTDRCLVSLVSGERATIRKEFPNRYSNTMFELFEENYLPFFSYDECSDMVEKLGKLIGLEYTKESLGVIFEATGGHPYITRVLCSCLAEKLKVGIVSYNDVKSIQQPTLDILNEYFKAWWLRADEIERSLIEIFLRGNNTLTDYSDYQEAIRNLTKHGFVAQQPNKNYYITAGLLDAWLIQRGLGRHE